MWATEFHGPVKIVHYEDLIRNLDATLRDILSFLNRPVDEQLLNCTLSSRDGIYKRSRSKKDLVDPYWDDLQRIIGEKKQEVFQKIGSSRW